MAQASAEQVQTWNRQLRREGNPFRLRLTSQSPYLYIRGPFRDLRWSGFPGQPPSPRAGGGAITA
ncbi:MAG: hypothetical protein ACKO0M_00180 [Cyanobium sp.]